MRGWAVSLSQPCAGCGWGAAVGWAQEAADPPRLPQGAWSGPWVSTEVLAAAIGLLVYYLALSAKGTIQA